MNKRIKDMRTLNFKGQTYILNHHLAECNNQLGPKCYKELIVPCEVPHVDSIFLSHLGPALCAKGLNLNWGVGDFI